MQNRAENFFQYLFCVWFTVHAHVQCSNASSLAAVNTQVCCNGNDQHLVLGFFPFSVPPFHVHKRVTLHIMEPDRRQTNKNKQNEHDEGGHRHYEISFSYNNIIILLRQTAHNGPIHAFGAFSLSFFFCRCRSGVIFCIYDIILKRDNGQVDGHRHREWLTQHVRNKFNAK